MRKLFSTTTLICLTLVLAAQIQCNTDTLPSSDYLVKDENTDHTDETDHTDHTEATENTEFTEEELKFRSSSQTACGLLCTA